MKAIMRTALALFPAWLFLLAPLSVRAGEVWWVDDNGPGDPGPGNPEIGDPAEDGSADHPFDTIQEAVDRAHRGDRIALRKGVYRGEGNRDIDFKGKNITVIGVKGADQCVIDAEHRGRGFLFHSGETGGSKLAGVTVRNGAARHGGGISCLSGSSPRIVRCVISGNRAERHGGGIYSSESSPLIRHCRITGNQIVHHYGRGGGLHCEGGRPKIVNCIISGNSVRSPGYGAPFGGGLCFWRSEPRITDCVITQNEAGYGGGVYSCHQSRPVLRGCSLSDNEAGHGGGIYCLARGVLDRCKISGNRAAAAAGGAFVRHGARLSGCFITGNRAGRAGGGLRCRDGEITVRHCTIAGNRVKGEGGGLHGGMGTLIRVKGSIFWGNRAGTGPQILLRGLRDRESRTDYDAVLHISYSNVEGGRAAVHEGPQSELKWREGMISQDPRFRDEGADYHLTAGSPCIDRGDPEEAADPEAKDIDGEPRVHRRRIDMGADEYRD
jgi:hypothetical protein